MSVVFIRWPCRERTPVPEGKKGTVTGILAGEKEKIPILLYGQCKAASGRLRMGAPFQGIVHQVCQKLTEVNVPDRRRLRDINLVQSGNSGVFRLALVVGEYGIQQRVGGIGDGRD